MGTGVLTLWLLVVGVDVAPPVERGGEIRAFFRDPDGHLLEISEVR